MGTYATSTDVDTLRTAMLAICGTDGSELTHTNSATQTLLRAQVSLVVDKYCDTQLAIINVNASAAASYGNGLGANVTKQELARLEAAAVKHWDEFVRVCAMGGVTVPSMDDAVSFWDLSGVSHT